MKISRGAYEPDGRRVGFGNSVEDRQIHGRQHIDRRVMFQAERLEPPAPAAVVAFEEPFRCECLLEPLPRGACARPANPGGVTTWTRLLGPASDVTGRGSLDRQAVFGVWRGIVRPSERADQFLHRL